MATSDFGRAFAAARRAGKKEFEHGGKKFTTETREEKTSRVGKDVSSKADALRSASRATTTAAAREGAAKRKKSADDAKFAASVSDYVRSQSAARDARERRRLAADVAAMLPIGVASGMLAKGVAKGASAAKAAKAAKAAPSIGPTGVARKVMPSRPAAQVGRKTGASDTLRRSEEGFSPDEALKAIAKKYPAKDATAKQAAKPAAKKPGNPPPADDFGAGMRRGGKVAKKRYI